MEPLEDASMEILPEQMTDEDEHGTCAASVAAGQQFGAAPRADLHLVKITGNYIDRTAAVEPGQRPIVLSGDFTFEGLVHAFEHILDIIKNPANPKNKKAVVNMSWCKQFLGSLNFEY